MQALRYLTVLFPFFLLGCHNDSACHSSDPKLLFVSDFEAGNLSCWRLAGNAPTITTEQVRAGNYALKSSLDRLHDKVDYRTEVSLHRRRPITQVGEEYWYAFSIYLPEDYIPDKFWEVVAQWHERPDFHLGENWRVPPLQLRTDHGKWTLDRRWDSKPNTHVNGKWEKPEYEGLEEYDFGEYQTGVWNDWVFHVKWSYESDGFLEVWKDGQKVLDQVGPNAYNDREGPYFKMGVYKGWRSSDEPSDAVTSRVIYHDEFRMGNAKASYEDVAPPAAE